jgi:bifunctional non-homologous end joining protein LigD
VPRRLEEYQAMRDFTATPEPAGDAAAPVADRQRFVIQQHDATRLHWDLRLEHDGVLASWALPRGLPWSPKVNHLAVHTEDHPLEYLEFSGAIPDGSYGAGSMFIWDHGTYEAEKYTDDKVIVTLHGDRATGKFALFETRGRDWIIHRMDPPEDPTREPLPAHLPLIDAVPGPLPTGDGWAFEVLWTGCRALVASSGGVVTISDRAGNDVSASFPEVRRVGRAIGYTEVVLDGVIVSPDGDAGWVERRRAVKSDSTIRKHARDHPLALMAFDVLWLDGHPTTARPWRERRALLDDLALRGPAWAAPAAHEGDGDAFLTAARENGLAGVVAKRVDAPYAPNPDAPPWITIPLA